MTNAKDADTKCATLFPGIQAVGEEEAREIARGEVPQLGRAVGRSISKPNRP